MKQSKYHQRTGKGVGSGVAPGGVGLRVGIGDGKSIVGAGSVGKGVMGAGVSGAGVASGVASGVGAGVVGRGSVGKGVFGAFVSGGRGLPPVGTNVFSVPRGSIG